MPRTNRATHTVNATVDRIEGSLAVLDADGFALQLPRAWLPAETREGSGVQITIATRDASDLDDSVRNRLAQLTRKPR
jgi:hypothetical protein